MSQVHTEQRRKPLRINENKIRTLEVSTVDDIKRAPDEHAVTPTKPVTVNASNGKRFFF
jgi:hypothetical protein